MKRKLAFANRNRREILRDPLSYIFCLGFPLVMLVVMTLIDASIPEEAGVTMFRIENLSAGIAVFGQTFTMLFTALTVAKDRSGSFLVRLYATPMRSGDFIAGYLLPTLLISVVQTALIYLASAVIAAIVGATLSPLGLLASLFTLLPSAILFLGFGLLFGTLLSEKAAPGLCSLIISLGSFLGCIWFDADKTGGVLLKLCRVLPFYYCTRSARAAVRLDFSADAWGVPLLIVALCAAALTLAASVAFRSKMRADLG